MGLVCDGMFFSDGTWLEAVQASPSVDLKSSRNARFLGSSRPCEADSGEGARNLGFSKPTGEPNVLAAALGPTQLHYWSL